MIQRRRIGLYRVGGENDPEKEVGAVVGVDGAGVLSNPADPGFLRPGLLQHRAGIDVVAVLSREAFSQQAAAALQPFFDDPVVIGAAGIGGYFGPVTRGIGDPDGAAVSVVHRGHDDAAGALEHFPYILAALGVSSEVVHVSRVAPIEPLSEMVGAWSAPGVGESNPVETVFEKEFTEIPGQPRRVLGGLSRLFSLRACVLRILHLHSRTCHFQF